MTRKGKLPFKHYPSGMKHMLKDMNVHVPVLFCSLGLTVLALECSAETMIYTIIKFEQCSLCISKILVHNFSPNVAATLIS